MHKKIICSTSTYSAGCTFMDWSILFLNGKNNFFNSKLNSFSKLVDNPILQVNAHGHDRNHPSGLNQTQQYVETFLNSHHDMYTVYPWMIQFQDAVKTLKISKDQLNDVAINQSVIDYQLNDFSQICDYIFDLQADLIYVNQTNPILDLESRHNGKDFNADQLEFQNLYFSKSLKKWEKLGLTNIWDVRERLALGTRPFTDLHKPNINFSRPHFYVDSMEWFTQGQSVITKVMDFCDLKIDKSRWNQWISAYHNWQTILQPRLKFCYQLPHIIDSIINDWYYEIDLSFNQEVVVQHCLIYQHNLNLKTWQLEKFPNNTQDLHKLLENNIHPL